MAWLEKHNGGYRIAYREGKKVRRIPAFTDRRASEAKLGKFEVAQDRGEAGMFVKLGEHRNRPPTEHVADWIAELREAGRDEAYIHPCQSRLLRLVAACGWTRFADITAESFIAWRETAKSEVAHNAKDPTTAKIEAMGARTRNHYKETLRSFCRWAMKRGRLVSNPIEHVESLDTAGDIRRARRELTAQEAVDLLTAVPKEYTLLYHVALQTGLRAGEMAALQWGDVRLDSPSPFIQLRAETTKSRRADVLPIRVDLAKMLREARGDAADAANVFHRIPRATEHRRWLEAAGMQYVNELGERLDIHSLRHSYVSWLAAAGVSPKELMTLARHTDARLTLGRYSHVRLFNLSAAVEKLPTLGDGQEATTQAMTGTDGRPALADELKGKLGVAPGVARLPREGHLLAYNGRVEETKSLWKSPQLAAKGHVMQGLTLEEDRAGDGIRTHDVSLGKAAFYH